MFDLSITGVIASLTLSRPERRNAIPFEGWRELAEKVAEAGDGGARVILLRGTPEGAFCSGADISDFDVFKDDAEARSAFRLAMRLGLDGLRQGLPSIAVVEGACYGAGVALAMACDIRLAGPGATFAITPAKFGISYPQEDVHQLVARVGPGHAARLLLGAGPIDGAEAERIGLVERFVPDVLEAEVASMVEAMASNDPESLTTLKRAIALAAVATARDEAMDRRFDDLLGSDALSERLEARRDRRA